MDKPNQPESPTGGSPVPLSFSLNQAAALCGVLPQQLSEWTDCGYVHATGAGDRRRYDRGALREILTLRDALRASRAARNAPPTRLNPDNQPGSLSGRSAAFADGPAGIRPFSATGPVEGSAMQPETRRPQEFSVEMIPMDDAHLTLQAEMYFALNAGAPCTAADVAANLHVCEGDTARILDALVQAGALVRSRINGEIYYHSGCAQLHGPSPREQRIRARRRSRVPSRPQ